MKQRVRASPAISRLTIAPGRSLSTPKRAGWIRVADNFTPFREEFPNNAVSLLPRHRASREIGTLRQTYIAADEGIALSQLALAWLLALGDDIACAG
jgi:hypothetical protein